MEIFKLKKDEAYIELNNLLKIMSYVASGGEAKLQIKEGHVMVNGEVELRVRKKLKSGDKILLDSNECRIQ